MNDELLEEIKIPLFTCPLLSPHSLTAPFKTAQNLSCFEMIDMDYVQHSGEGKKLWEALRMIINKAKENDFELIAISTSAHVSLTFPENHYLLRNIFEASSQKVDILLGHLNDFTYAVPVSKFRFWIDRFQGSDFLVIFRQLYDKILAIFDCEDESVFQTLSLLTVNKMVLFPFVIDDDENVDNAKYTALTGRHKLEIYNNVRNRYLIR